MGIAPYNGLGEEMGKIKMPDDAPERGFQRVPHQPSQPPPKKKLSLATALGPGLITGASDDDPSGVATYSQMGAQFGFGMLWTMLFSFPLMVAIQEISALIGRVTGKGIAANMKCCFPAWLTFGVVGLMLVANVVNLGADVGAMGAAAILMLPGSSKFYAVGLGLVSTVLIVFVPYDRYVFFLKWLTFALFSYVAVVFCVHVQWSKALLATVVPHMEWNKDFIGGIVAILGTTISPYLFFWQSSEEVEEEERDPDQKPLIKAPRQAAYQIPRIRLDTFIGMGFSQMVAFFIILSVATTLHAKGVTDIQTAEQAAAALRPVAGPATFLLFALGIIGTGMLAVPVLAGSAAYAVGETAGWPVGLERKPYQAKGFYLILALSMLIGISMNFMHINMIKALIWSAILNGVTAGPIMVVMMLMGHKKEIMGQFTLSKGLTAVGWLATAVMLLCALGLIWTSL
ncbi:MAG TPA: divalent metal cation transporter [Fimbriimonadaceae bacterium]|jgi:NRAMP (natural resistance-associated macrophage protein)-like metal ion transporter